ncbi:MAG: L-rhamnose/proton symporter RhaT [Acutalibacteraceae bacterium]
MLNNYVFSAMAGVTWYMQFFFYSMGETKMGKYSFSSWTLHMASIIIFSTLWGIFLREWHGTSSKTKVLVAVGLAGTDSLHIDCGLRKLSEYAAPVCGSSGQPIDGFVFGGYVQQRQRAKTLWRCFF